MTAGAAVVRPAVDRVDAPLKVTGRAQYPIDVAYPDLAQAALVRSTVAAGRVVAVDVSEAQAAPGVLAVITHLTAPRLKAAPATILGPPPPMPLQDDRIHYHGQAVAVVVA